MGLSETSLSHSSREIQYEINDALHSGLLQQLLAGLVCCIKVCGRALASKGAYRHLSNTLSTHVELSTHIGL